MESAAVKVATATDIKAHLKHYKGKFVPAIGQKGTVFYGSDGKTLYRVTKKVHSEVVEDYKFFDAKLDETFTKLSDALAAGGKGNKKKPVVDGATNTITSTTSGYIMVPVAAFFGELDGQHEFIAVKKGGEVSLKHSKKSDKTPVKREKKHSTDNT